MRITVVGLGKIGLPLAVQFAESGHQVIGADVNQAVVDLVNHGSEPFPGEAQLAEKLASVVSGGKLRATTDTTNAVRESRSWWSSCPCSSTRTDCPTSAGWIPRAPTSLVVSPLGR